MAPPPPWLQTLWEIRPCDPLVIGEPLCFNQSCVSSSRQASSSCAPQPAQQKTVLELMAQLRTAAQDAKNGAAIAAGAADNANALAEQIVAAVLAENQQSGPAQRDPEPTTSAVSTLSLDVSDPWEPIADPLGGCMQTTQTLRLLVSARASPRTAQVARPHQHRQKRPPAQTMLLLPRTPSLMRLGHFDHLCSHSNT